MILTIVRGLPGSGKSTYAKTIGCYHIEADMYQMRDGKYQFESERHKTAHAWCLANVKAALEAGMDVVVSNTFTTIKELTPYIELAQQAMSEIRVVCMSNNYGNTHGVPSEVLEKMAMRWEAWPGEEVKE